MKKIVLAALLSASILTPAAAQCPAPGYQGVPCTVNTPSGPVTLLHHRDGKSTSYTTPDGRSGTLVTIKCGKDYCIYNNGRLWRRGKVEGGQWKNRGG
jgi:hypothetical protein